MSNSVKTKKGTELPLMSLKGKPYMQVAHRLVWFNEDVENFEITTEFLQLTETNAVVKATVKILDKEGKLVKSACGTKAENAGSFGDFVEKAETGALGRAITNLGYGTAYALADLDEGERIIDGPVVPPKKADKTSEVVALPPTTTSLDGAAPSIPSNGANSASQSQDAGRRPRTFKKNANGAAKTVAAVNGDGF